MIDQYDDKPFRVSTNGPEGPSLTVLPTQVNAVKEVLDGANVPYSLGSDAIRMDGKPPTTTFNLGTGADVAAIEKLLKEA